MEKKGISPIIKQSYPKLNKNSEFTVSKSNKINKDECSSLLSTDLNQEGQTFYHSNDVPFNRNN